LPGRLQNTYLQTKFGYLIFVLFNSYVVIFLL
jgi:hypothetical protein